MSGPNIGIVTAYNDMLSAHQPYGRYPEQMKIFAREAGATAQVAGGTPAMCDGVTQGQPGMDLSLFSRDVIALSTAVALSHGMFDGVAMLGICDKIVPGLLIGALRFGHLPALLVPGGRCRRASPTRKSSASASSTPRARRARRSCSRRDPPATTRAGTCTFYGTANSNQMMMELMGLHIPGAAFINPGTPLRQALTRAAVHRLAELARTRRAAAGQVIDEKAIVNATVGLLATGGSTNHAIHLPAIARAAGIVIDWQDLDELSAAVPLIARVYPNGSGDVNDFHQPAAWLSSPDLAERGPAPCRHADRGRRRAGRLHRHSRLDGEEIAWEAGREAAIRRCCARRATRSCPMAECGWCQGNLGRATFKTSAVDRGALDGRGAGRIFSDQDQVLAAFKAGELDRDVVVVVRFQGPRANGMPELHKLTPALGVLQDRGHRSRWSPTAACRAPAARCRRRSMSARRRSTTGRWRACATATWSAVRQSRLAGSGRCRPRSARSGAARRLHRSARAASCSPSCAPPPTMPSRAARPCSTRWTKSHEPDDRGRRYRRHPRPLRPGRGRRMAGSCRWASRSRSRPPTMPASRPPGRNSARVAGVDLPDALGMAFAGPVGGDVLKLTNNPWVIRPALMKERLGVHQHKIVNDFGAVAHAVAQFDETHFDHLCGPDGPMPATGVTSVIGPGTGLGVAQLLKTADGYHVIETEGGHVDFAPLDALEDQMLAYLRSSFRGYRSSGSSRDRASSTSTTPSRRSRARQSSIPTTRRSGRRRWRVRPAGDRRARPLLPVAGRRSGRPGAGAWLQRGRDRRRARLPAQGPLCHQRLRRPLHRQGPVRAADGRHSGQAAQSSAAGPLWRGRRLRAGVCMSIDEVMRSAPVIPVLVLDGSIDPVGAGRNAGRGRAAGDRGHDAHTIRAGGDEGDGLGRRRGRRRRHRAQ